MFERLQPQPRGILADKSVELSANVVQRESVLLPLEFRIPFFRLRQNLLDDPSDLFRLEVDSNAEIGVANVLGEKSSGAKLIPDREQNVGKIVERQNVAVEQIVNGIGKVSFVQNLKKNFPFVTFETGDA